jgi:hypothetical protein
MGAGRQECHAPVGVIKLAGWLLGMAIKYLKWRGEIDENASDKIQDFMEDVK